MQTQTPSAASSSPEPYLKIRGVTKRFDKFTALQAIDLDIYPGEFVSFLGPSGCGKTTLLRAISGLDVQSEGTISQGGKDISTLPVNQRDFGIVFQSYALFPNLRIKDNVAYGLVSAGRSRSEISTRVTELLALVGLSDQAMKFPAQLSGGQQQRIALARALALSPGLLLLDEPLSALDARVRARLRGEIRDLQQRLGITTIMVTHDQEEALTMSDRIVVMSRGRIEQVGTPDEVYSRPASPFVADFVGRMNFLDGRLVAPNQANCKGVDLTFAGEMTYAAETQVTVCVRPEDIVVRNINGANTNVFDADVGVMEFVGNHFATTLHINGTNLNVAADLSMNDVRDLGVKPGGTIKALLPADRLRVFATPGAAAQ
ncbi:putative 2-aminoethylphosphonate ABC transporter ATP-binding protein [Reyranella sp. CPCC 100927]|uniref:putative 2-aminoethylphosphonate ABC transporter ATP-binding protein n=1 Tax=Reyranella sp. CPCC 100927 TaxID=2599616 RepID=UPI0011B48F74|nr:putative 2-aminoethylphosphonate ABC transporter ATP-binding protein [Reyranella sp. CPCC 100927]TWT00656.1 putative 2-aminoethylphosphonate ABC transporter ATP-binding protein [Reyranella sp. CPCC 100927]